MSHEEMAEELESLDNGLTNWEREFLESVMARIAEEKPLSVKQRKTVEDLYRKYVGEPEDEEEEEDENEVEEEEEEPSDEGLGGDA